MLGPTFILLLTKAPGVAAPTDVEIEPAAEESADSSSADAPPPPAPKVSDATLGSLDGEDIEVLDDSGDVVASGQLRTFDALSLVLLVQDGSVVEVARSLIAKVRLRPPAEPLPPSIAPMPATAPTDLENLVPEGFARAGLRGGLLLGLGLPTVIGGIWLQTRGEDYALCDAQSICTFEHVLHAEYTASGTVLTLGGGFMAMLGTSQLVGERWVWHNRDQIAEADPHRGKLLGLGITTIVVGAGLWAGGLAMLIVGRDDISNYAENYDDAASAAALARGSYLMSGSGLGLVSIGAGVIAGAQTRSRWVRRLTLSPTSGRGLVGAQLRGTF